MARRDPQYARHRAVKEERTPPKSLTEVRDQLSAEFSTILKERKVLELRIGQASARIDKLEADIGFLSNQVRELNELKQARGMCALCHRTSTPGDYLCGDCRES